MWTGCKTKLIGCALAICLGVPALAADKTDDALLGLVLARARKALYQSKFDDALAKVRQALKTAPDSIPAHHLYQDIMGDMTKMALMKQHRLANEKRQQAAHKVQLSREQIKSFKEYERDVKRFVKKNIGKEQQVLKEYAARFKRAPKSAAAAYLYGRLVLDLAEKEKLFRQALALDPKFHWAHCGLGFLYERQGKPAESEREFKAALAVQPKSPDALVGLGFLYMNQGKNDPAIDSFKKALSLDVTNIDGHMDLGYVYRRLSEVDKAVAEFQQVLKIDPDNPWAFNSLGACYYRLALYNQALKCYRKAIASPRYDTPELAYLNLGFVYRRKRLYTLAAAQFRKAFEAKPGFAYAHSQLAQVLYHLKKYDEAWAQVREAQKLGCKVNPEFIIALKKAAGGGG